MSSWKASGPVGFAAGFYQKSWELVGNDISGYITALWDNPDDIKDINQIEIVIIPKVNHPTQVHKFRPISLCNNVYKCLSKIVVNRLKMIIDNIFSPFQTCFIPGRCIQDNIIHAQELTYNMSRSKGKVESFVIKVDLAKAYYNTTNLLRIYNEKSESKHRI